MNQELLSPGCYLIWYIPVGAAEFRYYDGTLRVYPDEQDDKALNLSGDLYGCSRNKPRWPKKDEIPIFPIGDYRYYLKVKRLPSNSTISGKGFKLVFERYRFQGNFPSTIALSTFAWDKEGSFSALMSLNNPVPPGFSQPPFFSGEVKDKHGTKVGDLVMGWIDEYLRRSKICIHRVTFTEGGVRKHPEEPLGSGGGETWQSIFEAVKWKIEKPTVSDDLKEPSGELWDKSELNEAIVNFSRLSDLDKEWSYHLLCVRKIQDHKDSDGNPVQVFGLMFDDIQADANLLPRQGAAIASRQTAPPPLQGLADEQPASYFRTAVHEIGHAMGLYHNHSGRHIMCITNCLIDNKAGGGFPKNIQYSFSSENVNRLRHMPDMWVRPGGTPFDEFEVPYGTTPISGADPVGSARGENNAGLKVKVYPLLKRVPLGAPVRINYILIATADTEVPVDLSLESRHVRGKVVGPGGVMRTFRSILRCTDSAGTRRQLKKGEEIRQSITLLAGREGALFPKAGKYQITVGLAWHRRNSLVRVLGKTSIEVATVVKQNLTVAKRLIENPRTLLALAVGGDRFQNAIQPGLDDPTLRPHYLFIRAKNMAKRFFNRPARLPQACKLLNKHWAETVILSGAEIGRILALIEQADDQTKRDKNVRELCQKLADRLKTMEGDVGDQIRKLAKELAERWRVSG